MRRRATFTLYCGLPDELGADELEVVTTKLIEFLGGGGMAVLNATWSCPELGRGKQPPGPVLAFERPPECVCTGDGHKPDCPLWLSLSDA